MKNIKSLVIWSLLTGVCTSLACDAPFEIVNGSEIGNHHVNVHGDEEEEENRRHMAMDMEVRKPHGYG